MSDPAFWSQAIATIFSKQPKTPMSFYSRLIWIVLAGIIGPLYSNLGQATKPYFVMASLGLALAVAIWVSILVWYRPEHLLYGAETHFEKWKTAYGTEQGAALSTRPTTTGTQDKKQ